MGEEEIFNNRLLFSYRFLEIFVQGQGLDGEGQSCDRGDPPVPPPLGKALRCNFLSALSQNIGFVQY